MNHKTYNTNATVPIVMSALLVALCIAILLSMMPGCTAADRQRAGEAAELVGVAADEIELRKEDPVGHVADVVKDKLADMRDRGVLLEHDYQASLATLNQSLAELDAHLPSPQTVDAWVQEMRRMQNLLQSIADAPDGTAAAADAVAGAAAMAAPMAGPYGPFVAIGGAVAAAIISAIGGARAGKRAGLGEGLNLGVQRTAMPIDDARDVAIENELATRFPGRRFLVVDKDKVAKSHVRSGVATTIEQVTSGAE